MLSKLIRFFLKKMTPKKIFNFFKVWISYWFSAITKKVWRWGMPFSASFEPSAICNLKCPECPVGNGKLKRKQGLSNFDTFKNFIDQASPYLMNLFLYFQGEPFINKEIFKMIEYANSKNIFTATSTNGHFFTKENILKIIDSGLDYLIISLDGASQQTYSQYRIGGNIETVIKGVRELINLRNSLNSKRPFIEIQFIVMGTNEHEIKKIKQLAKELKVDVLKFKSVQIYDFKNGLKFLPKKLTKFSRYKIENGQVRLKKRLKNRCWRLWNSAVITWNGDVLPCCFDKDAEYAFGNIKEKPLAELIKNQKFKKFALKVLTDRKSIPICRNCTE